MRFGIYQTADHDAGALHAVHVVEQRAHFPGRDLARCCDEAARCGRAFSLREIERRMVNESGSVVARLGETHETPVRDVYLLSGPLEDHSDRESRLDTEAECLHALSAVVRAAQRWVARSSCRRIPVARCHVSGCRR